MTSAGNTGRRVALFIGNGAYLYTTKLENSRNDAVGISTVLQRLGFSVIPGYDLGRDAMEDTLGEFERKLDGARVALFYFAGHGLQVDGQNYLIPIDAQLTQETHLRRRTFNLNELFEMMTRFADTNLLLLDACRENPFPRSPLSNSRARLVLRSGLAKITGENGTFIAYATAPNCIAIDKAGSSNSPFTEALLQNIETPGLPIHSLMIKVRNQVLQKTEQKQRPWEESSLQEEFYFKPLIEKAASQQPQSTANEPPFAEITALPRTAEDPLAAEPRGPSRISPANSAKIGVMLATVAALTVGLWYLANSSWVCRFRNSESC